ncbi:MAG: hypothetical protein ACK2TT_02920 [Anaerolineales bacterium]
MSEQTQETTAVDIWEVDPSSERKPGWKHLAVFLILVLSGTVLGSLSSLSFRITNAIDPASPAYGINYFWLGIVVQQVGSIWFGAWGVLAGIVFPFISNSVTQTPLLISAAYFPANFVQSFLPAWIFRRLKLNPRLESGRDFLYLFLTMVLSSLFGAFWSVFILVFVLGRLEQGQALLNFFGWFGGNMVAGIFFNYFLLKALSPAILKSKRFVKRWWS